jgi:hypothetical protein
MGLKSSESHKFAINSNTISCLLEQTKLRHEIVMSLGDINNSVRNNNIAHSQQQRRNNRNTITTTPFHFTYFRNFERPLPVVIERLLASRMQA